MGLFVRLWVIATIFSAFCPLRVEYYHNIGINSRYGGILYPYPPYIETRKSGLPQNFVYIFFIIEFFVKFFYFYNI